MTNAITLTLGILGNAISILVFTSPMRTFWNIYKKKSTENYKSLPYLCTLLSTLLWTYYGLIKTNGILIVTINVAGSFLEAFYLVVFLIYAPKPKKIQTAGILFLLDILVYGLIVFLTLLLSHGDKRVMVVGAICAAISVSMYASPLGAMRMVIRTRSVDYMPFLLSLFLFLNGATWSVYALLVKDIFLQIPNTIGFVLGGAQLLVYFYYKNAKPPQKDFDKELNKVADIESGSHSSTLTRKTSNTKMLRTTSKMNDEGFIQENNTKVHKPTIQMNGIQ